MVDRHAHRGRVPRRDAEAGRGRLTVVVQRFRFFDEEFVMSTALWLRIASVISLVFTAGHTLGGRRSWSFSGEAEVLNAMRTFRFQAFGVSWTYMDFYRGFGF